MTAGAVSELLDELQAKAMLSYISDLHDPSASKRVAVAVRSVQAVDYPTDVWAEAAVYITGSQPSLRDTESIINYITDSLEHK